MFTWLLLAVAYGGNSSTRKYYGSRLRVCVPVLGGDVFMSFCADERLGKGRHNRISRCWGHGRREMEILAARLIRRMV